eukprot:1266437-Pleurochrysis_carterae.AAC.1
MFERASTASACACVCRRRRDLMRSSLSVHAAACKAGRSFRCPVGSPARSLSRAPVLVKDLPAFVPSH